MQLKINNYNLPNKNNKNSRINFSSTRLLKGKISHQTNFFRPDLNWDVLFTHITKKMPEDTVILNYACSDGSEAYSLSLLLIDRLGEKAKKYFPIKAFDISKQIIKKAKSGVIGITETSNQDVHDINALRNKIKLKYEDFFKKISSNKHPDEVVGAAFFMDYELPIKAEQHQVSESLKRTIDFQVSDITKDFKKSIIDKPTVVMFRNAWRYLSNENSRENLAFDLFNNIKKGSIVVTGCAEKEDGYFQYLLKAGFKQNKDHENIFMKDV